MKKREKEEKVIEKIDIGRGRRRGERLRKRRRKEERKTTGKKRCFDSRRRERRQKKRKEGNEKKTEAKEADLWSYPPLYLDIGRNIKREEGRELCDVCLHKF